MAAENGTLCTIPLRNNNQYSSEKTSKYILGVDDHDLVMMQGSEQPFGNAVCQ
jgi:hypothetical protein